MTERRDDAEEREGPVIRDNRRIDPDTGAVRKPAGQPASGAAGPGGRSGSTDRAGAQPKRVTPAAEGDEVIKLTEELGERTADLQRLQAEYANYRKRVDRDRIAVREQALANVLNELLPILDDIGRARDHEELTGGFKSVGEALEATVGKLGLEKFGERGEPFDPTVHEALMHSYSAEVTEPTSVDVLQPGYRIGDRILRPARVAVAEPGSDEPPSGEGGEGDDNDK